MKINGAAVAGSVLALAIAAAAQAPPHTSPQPPTVVSTPAQRTGLDLVIYSGGFALVRDRRQITLPAGAVTLRFDGVPDTIEPDSARLLAGPPAHPLQVAQKQFHPADLTPRSLIQAYTGKPVTLVRYRYINGKSRKVKLPATLISDQAGYVWRVNGHIESGNALPEFQVPSLPPGLFAEPTLTWQLNNRNAGPLTVEARYLAQKISWRATYALTLDAGGAEGQLTGWMALGNQSGETFPDAQVRLVAGQVHASTPQPPRPRPLFARMAAAAPAASPQVTAQKLYAYHLYTIRQPVTLVNGGSEQVRWLAAAQVPVRTIYVIQGTEAYFGPIQTSASQAVPVNVELVVKNERADGLGRALPGGGVRVYGPAPGGVEVFLGAGQIPDTPAGGTIHLQPGGSFDLTAERVETQFRQISPRQSQATYRVTVHNAMDHPVQVRDDETLRGAWTIVQSSEKFTQPDASTARFEIPVPARGESSLTYTVAERF